MNADNFPSPPEDTDNDKKSNPKVESRRPSIVDTKKKGIVTTQSTLDALPSDKSLLEEAAEDENKRQGSIVRNRLMQASQSFQAVRPAGLITPNFDNTSTSEPANLINQSRNMRRALDLSFHGQRPSELTGALSDIFMDNPLDGTMRTSKAEMKGTVRLAASAERTCTSSDSCLSRQKMFTSSTFANLLAALT